MKNIDLLDCGIAVFDDCLSEIFLKEYIDIYEKSELINNSWGAKNFTSSMTPAEVREFDLVFWKEIFVIYKNKFKSLKQSECCIPWYELQKKEFRQSDVFFPKKSGFNPIQLFNVVLFLNKNPQSSIIFLKQDKKISSSSGRVVIFPSSYTHRRVKYTNTSENQYFLNCVVQKK